MRFSIIGDLHGSIKYLQVIKNKLKKTDAVFITGDITGTISYSLILKSILKSRKISRREYAELVYKQYLPEFVKFQKKTANKIFSILSKLETPVFYTHGNSDSGEIHEIFQSIAKENHLLFYVGNNVAKFGKLIVAGYGFCSPAEYRESFQTPGEKNNVDIQVELANLKKQILSLKKNRDSLVIGLFHEPPKKTKLDFIPKKGVHGGSKLIADHIRNVQYDYVFTGHIHESQNFDYYNNTLLLNPGALVNRKWATLDSNKKQVILRKILVPLSLKGLIYQTREIFD
ncbi:MAG: metallophosphoesterase family protein [Candidatus Heimdallarchaeaceae archaeon]